MGDLYPYIAITFRADAAEARGDAAGALSILAEMPLGPDGRFFWRPWRIRHLTQLAELGSSLPRWATSRWILAQAMQLLDESRRGSALKALEIAVDLRGGDDELPGVDLADAHGRVMDRDWVFRQIHLYELGGLAHFVRRVAAPDLLAGAERIHDWVRARMGGFRLVACEPGSVIWEDVLTKAQVSVPNIGSAAMVMPGECVIGRLVPIEQGLMFESAPLLVPEEVALEVARDPGGWVDVLKAHRRDVDTVVAPQALLNDVPVALWHYALLSCVPEAKEPAPEHLARGALTLIRSIGAGWAPQPDELDPWACLSAALLEPSLGPMVSAMLEPADAELLRELSRRLAEPAATVGRLLAEEMLRAA